MSTVTLDGGTNPALAAEVRFLFCRQNFSIREKTSIMANTKAIETKDERKKVKRAARKAAPAKGPRTGARGENKQKLKKATRGQSKR